MTREELEAQIAFLHDRLSYLASFIENQHGKRAFIDLEIAVRDSVQAAQVARDMFRQCVTVVHRIENELENTTKTFVKEMRLARRQLRAKARK